MAEAVAETRTRAARTQALDGAVAPIAQHPPDPRRRLLVDRCALELLIGLGQGRRTGLLGVAQMPEHATMDKRRQIHLVGKTVTVLCISPDIGGPGQSPPRTQR